MSQPKAENDKPANKTDGEINAQTQGELSGMDMFAHRAMDNITEIRRRAYVLLSDPKHIRHRLLIDEGLKKNIQLIQDSCDEMTETLGALREISIAGMESVRQKFKASQLKREDSALV